MNTIIGGSASISAIVGILLCLIAGLSRLMGYYFLAGFEALTLLNLGVALMVLSAPLKLELIYQKLK